MSIKFVYYFRRWSISGAWSVLLFKHRSFIIVSTLLVLFTAVSTFIVSRSYFLQELRVEAAVETSIYKEIMQRWLEKFRPLPSTYAAYPLMRRVLVVPSRINIEATNETLDGWRSASGASDIYLLDRNGLTIAASNWEDSATFIGHDYSFRPYYTQAMQGRLGRFFALDEESGKRGYFLSHPVRQNNKIIGVLVVKLSVDEVEQELRARNNEIFVTDEAGVVIIASHPDWRLKTMEILNEKTISRIQSERQFSLDTLNIVPIRNVATIPDPEFGTLVQTIGDRSEKREREFLQYALPMTAEEWYIHLLVPTQGAFDSALLVSLVVTSVVTVVLLVALIVLQRRDRLMQMLEFRARARAALEHEVEERTADLERSNEELRQTQSDLVHAGKMVVLGQMSTALSHEFNQPLTAIRTYAENASAFMERGMDDKALNNMQRILSLTERMAKLSRRLSIFARKPDDNVAPVRLRDAVYEALELLEARIQRSGVDVSVSVDPKLCFLGGQVRLQHVLMNLMANAMDEISRQEEKNSQQENGQEKNRPRKKQPGKNAQDKKWVKIEAWQEGEKIMMMVTDSGPGVDDSIKDKIFDPFFTTKDVGKGVGLGLSISHNIIGDFGGNIRVGDANGGGACFQIELNAADENELDQKAIA